MCMVLHSWRCQLFCIISNLLSTEHFHGWLNLRRIDLQHNKRSLFYKLFRSNLLASSTQKYNIMCAWKNYTNMINKLILYYRKSYVYIMQLLFGRVRNDDSFISTECDGMYTRGDRRDVLGWLKPRGHGYERYTPRRGPSRK